jgi:hypothetical protein
MEPLKRINLIPVKLESGFEIGVHPEVLKILNLRPGQLVDSGMLKRILGENKRFFSG